jgi:chromosome segregation ATPase
MSDMTDQSLREQLDKALSDAERLQEEAERCDQQRDDLREKIERLREALDACYDKPWRTRLIIEKAFLDREGEESDDDRPEPYETLQMRRDREGEE